MNSQAEVVPPALAGRFKFRRLLGRGGFGRVLLVDDLETGQAAALKILETPDGECDSADRFRREARLTAELLHPNLVKVRGHGFTEEATAWIAYEYIEGEDLATVLRMVGALDPRKVASWGAQIAEALASIHEAGVVHRDVKPENLLVRNGDQPVLCDLGLAWVDGSSTVQTAEGLILGTPGYLAPELWLGNRPSPASDQFALAATLYQMAFGERLFPDPNPVVIMETMRAGWIPSAPEGRHGVPAGLVKVLLRGLSVSSKDRYGDLGELSEALGTAIDFDSRQHHVDPRATVVSRVEPASRLSRVTPKSPKPRARYAFGFAILLLGGVAGWLSGPKEALVVPLDVSDRPDSGPRSEPMDVALVDLLNFLKVPQDQDGAYVIERVPSGSPLDPESLLDPRFELKWKRYLDALIEWILAAEDHQRPPFQKTLQHHGDWVFHLLQNIRRLEMGGKILQRAPKKGEDFLDRLAPYTQIQVAWEMVKSSSFEAMQRLRREVPNPPPVLAVLQVTLSRYVDSEALVAPLREVAAGYASSEPVPNRAAHGLLVIDLARLTGLGRKISCEDAVALVRTVREIPPAAQGMLKPREMQRVISGAFGLMFRFHYHCPDSLSPQDRAWTAQMLRHFERRFLGLDRGLRIELRSHLLQALANLKKAGFVGGGEHGELMVRVRELADQLSDGGR